MKNRCDIVRKINQLEYKLKHELFETIPHGSTEHQLLEKEIHTLKWVNEEKEDTALGKFTGIMGINRNCQKEENK